MSDLPCRRRVHDSSRCYDVSFINHAAVHLCEVSVLRSRFPEGFETCDSYETRFEGRNVIEKCFVPFYRTELFLFLLVSCFIHDFIS